MFLLRRFSLIIPWKAIIFFKLCGFFCFFINLFCYSRLRRRSRCVSGSLLLLHAYLNSSQHVKTSHLFIFSKGIYASYMRILNFLSGICMVSFFISSNFCFRFSLSFFCVLHNLLQSLWEITSFADEVFHEQINGLRWKGDAF